MRLIYLNYEMVKKAEQIGAKKREINDRRDYSGDGKHYLSALGLQKLINGFINQVATLNDAPGDMKAPGSQNDCFYLPGKTGQ